MSINPRCNICLIQYNLFLELQKWLSINRQLIMPLFLLLFLSNNWVSGSSRKMCFSSRMRTIKIWRAEKLLVCFKSSPMFLYFHETISAPVFAGPRLGRDNLSKKAENYWPTVLRLFVKIWQKDKYCISDYKYCYSSFSISCWNFIKDSKIQNCRYRYIANTLHFNHLIFTKDTLITSVDYLKFY